MTVFRLLGSFALVAWMSAGFAAEVALRIIPPSATIVDQALRYRVLVLVRSDSEKPERITPRATAENAKVLSVVPTSAEISKTKSAVFTVNLAAEGLPKPGALHLTIQEKPSNSASCPLLPVLDLTAIEWQEWWQGERPSLDSLQGVPSPNTSWKTSSLPQEWQQLGVTWLRTRLMLPQTWRSLKFQLELAAVDDRDVTFLNGRQIGRTDGWDKPRVYPIPADQVRWGESNELCIAAENGFAGGGLYRTPIQLRIGDFGENARRDSLFSQSVGQEESKRTPPGPIGRPAPLRPVHVRDGVLRYSDGAEAALWGVNYYPQSWSQYEGLKRLGIDPRRSIDEDFDDFQRIGIEIIRIHVFDTEITDRAGNLVRNDHLDVLDYLVSQCNARGIYLMLTPIAWWGSPSSRPDSFSRNTPKQAMSLWPEAWPAQVNYLRQFLTHKNPYTGRRLLDEPCLALFEVINEPSYWSFGEVTQGKPGWLDGADLKDVARSQQGVLEAWKSFVASPDWKTPAAYTCFRYDTLRRYIDTMVRTIRDTGARQPIAYFSNPWAEVADVFEAISESACDAITIGAYPGGLPQDVRNDKQNLLGGIWNGSLDGRFAQKARLVYEFDASGTRDLVTMYPAIAREWRRLGVQVACQFQYDAKAVAHLNWDWPQHYLNLWYTPGKMAGYLIGGETFRRLPRGAVFPLNEDDQTFPPAAVSFRHNAAILCADDCYMQARKSDWQPLDIPKHPRRILSVGSCPYFDYDGSGIVDMRIDGDTAMLRVYPDVDRLQEGLRGTLEKPLSRLAPREHSFRLKLQGWSDAKVQRRLGDNWVDVPSRSGEFSITPGEYRLTR